MSVEFRLNLEEPVSRREIELFLKLLPSDLDGDEDLRRYSSRDQQLPSSLSVSVWERV